MNIMTDLVLACILIFSTCIFCDPTVEYGEFDLKVSKFITCKGPKRKDCSVVVAKIIGNKSVSYDMRVKENMKPSKGKIVAMSKGKHLVRLQVDNPCSHLFLRPLFKSMLNITDNCYILKGHYSFTVDLENIAKTYYQGSFIYGNFTFKSLFYNNDCNLSCAEVDVTISPKENHEILSKHREMITRTEQPHKSPRTN